MLGPSPCCGPKSPYSVHTPALTASSFSCPQGHGLWLKSKPSMRKIHRTSGRGHKYFYVPQARPSWMSWTSCLSEERNHT